MSATRPFLSIWFGNFFEPFYSNREAVRRGIREVADLGFNSINLDSKAWEDFFARYRGEPASPYVEMQEFMMAEAAKHGMDYTCLALYLCGDNLYPTIRDVPPVRGEESIRPNGEPMGTYKYWSPKAQATMVEHVQGLLKLYGKGMRRDAEGRIIMQTMFDPIVKPSFDEEGRQRYLDWLEKRYRADITVLNQRYGLLAASFKELKPGEYWLRPEVLDWVHCALPAAADFERRTPDFHRWTDNQTYLAGEMEEYFATMKKHWRELEPALFIEPVLHQWGYFFNPPGQDLWPTANRALDVYKLAPHVDGALYITSPLNAENLPDPMAVSVEGSIMRCANAGRSFTAGLYLGRHVNGDIYRVVPPAEAQATLIAAGAQGFHVYGYSGLDDGGVLYRTDDVFKDSLRQGNEWAAKVIPLLAGHERAKEVALLFPAEMNLYEPLTVDLEGRHRMDLLGWYTQFVDLGWHVDILHPDQVLAGLLTNYSHLILPHNSLYDLEDNHALESLVKNFVAGGGTVLHGPHCQLARQALGIEEETVDFDCIDWEEDIIPHGWSTVSFKRGNPIGPYIQSGKAAMVRSEIGRGQIYSFGFQYGYSYSRRTMPIVPPRYGRREMHPIVLQKETPVQKLVGFSPLAPSRPVKGMECARFGKGLVIVNHRSSPIDISGIGSKRSIAMLPVTGGRLAAHSAVYMEV